jgi:glycosyltransferase involved in cell wall biosynthesis
VFFAAPAIGLYLLRLRRTLSRLSPDVIHTNGFKMHVLGALAKSPQTPLIWHIHDYIGARPLMARVLRRCLRRCTAAIANSHSVEQDIKAVLGDKLPVQTVYNGIDTREFSPVGDSLDLDALAGVPKAPSGTLRVGMVTTLARWKGQEVFLRALASLPGNLRVRGYIVGGAVYQTDGSQYSVPELKEIAQRLGLDGRIAFTGFIDHPASAMRGLDVVVHASTAPEPFGLVVAEAMCCGCAVVAGNTGGASELFDAELNALGHPAGDATALAQTLLRLANDAGLRARLGACARIAASQRFDRARLAGQWTPIYSAASQRRVATLVA